MLRILVFLTLLTPSLCHAQEDSASITFGSVFALRCPDANNIDSMIAALKMIPGIKLNMDCFNKADEMVALYRAEDLRQWKKLKNQATSYRSGWREKIQAGVTPAALLPSALSTTGTAQGLRQL